MRHAESLNKKNDDFWSEPCGTNALVQMGMDADNFEDIKKFDHWYFEFYPYVLEYLNELDLKNAHVLEVGIGLGTVSRFLAERAKSLTCLDIARGAISYVKSTTKSIGNVEFICQSILEYKPSKKFDIIIAVGSLHHTGDLKSALSKVEELLNIDGTILVMVYYAFQPRRWIMHPLRTFKEFFETRSQGRRKRLVFEEQDVELRARADANQSGEAAPYTAFSSRKLFSERINVDYVTTLHNFHRVPVLSRFLSRSFFLKYFSQYFGCDIYAVGKFSKH